MTDLPVRPDLGPAAVFAPLTADALRGPTATPEAPPQASPTGYSLLGWLDRWIWKSRQRDLEAALAGATGVAEVENRLRARERNLLQRYY